MVKSVNFYQTMKRGLVNGGNIVRAFPRTGVFVASVFTNLLLTISTVDANLARMASERTKANECEVARTSS